MMVQNKREPAQHAAACPRSSRRTVVVPVPDDKEPDPPKLVAAKYIAGMSGRPPDRPFARSPDRSTGSSGRPPKTVQARSTSVYSVA